MSKNTCSSTASDYDERPSTPGFESVGSTLSPDSQPWSPGSLESRRSSRDSVQSNKFEDMIDVIPELLRDIEIENQDNIKQSAEQVKTLRQWQELPACREANIRTVQAASGKIQSNDHCSGWFGCQNARPQACLTDAGDETDPGAPWNIKAEPAAHTHALYTVV